MNTKQENKELNNRLTDEQRELATKNHNLIYAYAHKKNLFIEDYYDILAIGLCKATKMYDQYKGSFTTLCFKCMENELYNYWNSMQKKSYIPDNLILSYDTPQNIGYSDGQVDLVEVITDFNADNDISYAIMYYEIINKLTTKEKIIVQYLLNGFTHNEIANVFKCKQQNISYIVKKIRKKLS